jgi:hypothetical protein
MVMHACMHAYINTLHAYIYTYIYIETNEHKHTHTGARTHVHTTLVAYLHVEYVYEHGTGRACTHSIHTYITSIEPLLLHKRAYIHIRIHENSLSLQ